MSIRGYDSHQTRTHDVQVLVAAFGLWKKEWVYAEETVSEDPRNNSAWNQRAWILGLSLAARLKRQSDSSKNPSGTDRAFEEDPSDLQPRFLTGSLRDWLQREVQHAREHLCSMPHNESAWNYLVGLRDIVLGALRLASGPLRSLSHCNVG